eukprot:8946320-Pyramimonas_sp.AAC.1
MATAIPLMHVAGTLAVNAPSMQDAGALAAHAAPIPFNDPLIGRLEQQQHQAGTRRHRSARSAASRRVDSPSKTRP